MSDDLDYHITFLAVPSEDTDNKTQLSDENNDTKTGVIDEDPVVFLLGWYGCQDRHLAKYSDLYHTKGFITIRYIAGGDVVFMHGPDYTRRVASKLLNLLQEYSLMSSPVIFHVFSNGGAIVYREISHLLAHDKRYNDLVVKGTIFDSCPGRPQASKAGRAIMASLKMNYVFKLVIAFLALSYLYCQHWYRSVVRYIRSEPPREQMFDAIVNDTNSWPQLFLFSTNDQIIPVEGIEEVVSRRRKQGFPVEVVRWEDSGHVEHLRTHREAYINHCYQFVNKCLQAK